MTPPPPSRWGMITICLLAIAAAGCKGFDQDKKRPSVVEGNIRIVEFPSKLLEPGLVAGKDPSLYLVCGTDVYHLSFAPDCRVEGLPSRDSGNGYPITIAGRRWLLHSGDYWRITGTVNLQPLRLTTRLTLGLQVTSMTCITPGTGDSYSELGHIATDDGIFVEEGLRSTWVEGPAVHVKGSDVSVPLRSTINTNGETRVLGGQANIRVAASWTIDPNDLRPVSALFDATVLAVLVKPGDHVEKNQVLLTLDATVLQLELTHAQAELKVKKAERNQAMMKQELVEAEIYGKMAEATLAAIARLEYLIKEAEIRSPVRGEVIEGNFKPLAGSRVNTQQVLFQIAPRP